MKQTPDEKDGADPNDGIGFARLALARMVPSLKVPLPVVLAWSGAALLLVSCGKKGSGSSGSGKGGTAEYAYTNVEVGLSAEEREELWHTSEGSSLFPVGILQVLQDEKYGVPFIDSMVNYGFLPSEVSERNPYGLPVGWSTYVPPRSPHQLPYVGVNCAGCHTGEIHYQGKRLRIDGAPNMVDIEEWGLQIRNSLVATVEDPAKSFELLRGLVKLKIKREGILGTLRLADGTAGFMDRLHADLRRTNDRAASRALQLGAALKTLAESEDPDAAMKAIISRLEQSKEGLDSRDRKSVEDLLALVRAYAPLIKNRLGFALRAVRAIEISPEAGPGRDDPWGLIRNLLFETETKMTAPTSIPHLYYTRDVDWFHSDGNTTSLLDRNVAQSIALGAYVDAETKIGSFLPDRIVRLQTLLELLDAPKWPEEVLGAIDTERAERGEALYRRQSYALGGQNYSCWDCHESRKSKLFSVAELKTDPNRARDFMELLNGQPYFEAIVEKVAPIRDATLAANGMTIEEATNREELWRETGQYVGRQLDGVWSTAPYLHNGSVPTLYDLLLPADQRPREFKLGHREYDPRHVGYARDGAGSFTFQAAPDDQEGNSNAGHEYGAELSEDERWELIEYMKTL